VKGNRSSGSKYSVAKFSAAVCKGVASLNKVEGSK
jgi:hypothetical protein